MGIRVLIASDHPLTRTGLRQILKSVPDFQIVAEVETSAAISELCGRFSPQVVLLEITLPGPKGLRAASMLATSLPESRVVVVAGNENLHYVRSLLAAGVAGYVLRKASDEELILAVRKAAAGDTYLDSRLKAGISEAERKGSRGAPHPSALSKRELQALHAVARGFTSREIAQQMQVSIKTVETYRRRIYDKLGLRTRADLVHYALAAGLMEPGNGES
ncbi:MAG TPA: response regulator transcription factor [Terriglobales bacterium]|nr:response regulator transcription factor [Terriglobales bacterium]